MERFTTCKVELDLFDTTAVEDSKLAVDNVQPFADIENIRQKNSITKVATLESDYFLLDGSCSFYDDIVNSQSVEVPSNEGYMSNVFNSEIIAEFSKNHSSVGLTIHFWEMVPKQIEVIFYKDNSIIDHATFNPTIADCDKTSGDVIEYAYFCDIDVENYDKVKITLTSDDRFIRINYLEYGIKLEYGESETKKLKSCKVTEEADSLSTELSVNQSTVEIIDMEDLFKVTNPNSYYKYLQKRQVFKITETIDDKEVFIASHYLKEWNQTKVHSATFTLQDILGIMSDTTFGGNIYKEVTAGEIFDEIFNDFGYADYDIEEEVRNTILSGYLQTMSHREALQQVAFACGACVTTSRITGIKIFKPEYVNVGYINLDRKLLSNSETTQEDLVTSVRVTAHNYKLSSEAKEVYKEELEPGEYNVTFSNPCSNLTITGGTIINSNVNYATIKVETEGEVIITGNEYEDHTSTYAFEETDLPSATDENVVEVTDATLISKNNVKEIAKTLYKLKQFRIEQKAKIITQDEKVANMYAMKVIDEYAPILITKMETDLTGGFISSIEGIGYALKVQDYYMAGTELYAGEDAII